MGKKVEIYNSVEKAIIQSFEAADGRKLTRKAIIQKAMSIIGSKESTIAKRIDKMSNESYRYLIKVQRGIYELNPEIEFIFKREPITHNEQSTIISPRSREEHTEDLKPIIENWIENFPEPPAYENSVEFSQKVEKCEGFPLFKDLLIHLSSTDYDIDQKWKKYKKDVDELERDKGAALKLIEKIISEIFLGLKLTFVKRDTELGDFDCAYAYMIYKNLIYARLGKARVDKKYGDIFDEDEYYDKYRPEIEEFLGELETFKDRLKEMVIFMENHSAIWGDYDVIPNRYPYPDRLECIRVPEKDMEILKKGKDRAILLYYKLPKEIDTPVNEIVEHIIRLDDEREAIIEGLRDSLYCKSFLGECKYLGVPATK